MADEATYARSRRSTLLAASLDLEKLRLLLQLATETKFPDLRCYGHAARELGEVGRPVIGWLTSDAQGPPADLIGHIARYDTPVGRGPCFPLQEPTLG